MLLQSLKLPATITLLAIVDLGGSKGMPLVKVLVAKLFLHHGIHQGENKILASRFYTFISMVCLENQYPFAAQCSPVGISHFFKIQFLGLPEAV